MIHSTSALSFSVQWNKPTAAGLTSAASARSQPRVSSAASEAPIAASELQRVLAARDYLQQMLEGDAEERKAQAQARLEEAKQKLALLKRWGFNPEVVARGAAQLAREVGAAAEEFATAVAASGAPYGSASAGAGSEHADNPIIPPAYRDVMEDGSRPAGLSQSDRDTIEAFKSALRQIKQLLEKALRELRQQKLSQGDPGAAAAVEDALSALDGVTKAASPHAMSFSITI
jgi:hypothetical protein